MARMHADELEIREELVRGLIEEQFPEWADSQWGILFSQLWVK